MFQIGDKVVCIDSKLGIVSLNKQYIIHTVRGTTYVKVIGDNGKLSGDLLCKRFLLAKMQPPPKNDIEWLDRIQQNFKE